MTSGENLEAYEGEQSRKQPQCLWVLAFALATRAPEGTFAVSVRYVGGAPKNLSIVKRLATTLLVTAGSEDLISGWPGGGGGTI